MGVYLAHGESGHLSAPTRQLTSSAVEEAGAWDHRDPGLLPGVSVCDIKLPDKEPERLAVR